MPQLYGPQNTTMPFCSISLQTVPSRKKLGTKYSNRDKGKEEKKINWGEKNWMRTNTMKVKRGFKQPNSLLYWHWVARSQTGETELKSPYLICTCPENQNCETHHFQYISLKINSSKHQQAHQILLFYWFYCQVSKNQHFSTLSFIFSGYQKSSAF